MRTSWGKTIRGKWLSVRPSRLAVGPTTRRVVMFVLASFLCALPGPVTSADGNGNASAAQSASAAAGARLLASAQHQLDSGNATQAVQDANSALSKAPQLEDYAQWIRAQAEYRLRNFDDVSHSISRVFDWSPTSPFVGPAAALAVRASLDNGKPGNALELIRKYYEQIPAPQGDLLLAQCYQASGDLAQAEEYFQRVYYSYPTAKEATDAANALVDVKQKLGSNYKLPAPDSLLERAQKLFAANNPRAAKIELAAAVTETSGVQRDLARVRLGVADYLSNNTAAAFQYLSSLKVDDPEADAERLNYLIHSARKMDRHADIKPFLDDLTKNHSASLWRLDALIFVADQARTVNDPGTYVPLYKDCADTFPKEKRASWCHWQVAFDSYKHDSADAYNLLRDQVQQYPDADDANDALYFFGRLNEHNNDLGAARACYEQLIAHFPNTYYAVVTRDRLKDPAIQAATAKPEMVTFLSALAWRAPPQFPSFVPGKLAQSRLDRSALLTLAGLGDSAEGELKFGARNDGEQENVYAFELAKMAAARDAQDVAMRYVRTYAPGYLFTPLDQAPVEFWKLAFPMPYRSYIEQYSHAQGLDPFLVTALIRQESEFNAKVVSHANAYGLMQLLPTTGRQLARHFGVRRLSASQLLVAERNVQLGTYYFRSLLDSYGGQVELALASYNAGAGRANLWRSWGPFREQPEFVEAVPFHETRGYVQLVLRNADVYRRLYAHTTPDVPVYHPKPAPKTKPRRRKTHHRPSA